MIKQLEKGHYVDLSRLNDDSIIVDAGACEGAVIKELRTYPETKNCMIYAIEPSKANMDTLIGHGFDNVMLYDVALVAQTYTANKVLFHEVTGRPQWGYVKVGYEAKRRKGLPGKKYEVEALKMNDLFKQLKIDRIDYLKMDIEGVEFEIIDTLKPMYAEKIKQWSFEFHPAEGEMKKNLLKMLTVLGFTIYKEQTYKEIFCGRQ